MTARNMVIVKLKAKRIVIDHITFMDAEDLIVHFVGGEVLKLNNDEFMMVESMMSMFD